VLAPPQTNSRFSDGAPNPRQLWCRFTNPAIVGAAHWTHQTTPQLKLNSYGTKSLSPIRRSRNAGHPAGLLDRGAASFKLHKPPVAQLPFTSGYQSLHQLPASGSPSRPAPRLRQRAEPPASSAIAGNEAEDTSPSFSSNKLIATVLRVHSLVYTDTSALTETGK